MLGEATGPLPGGEAARAPARRVLSRLSRTRRQVCESRSTRGQGPVAPHSTALPRPLPPGLAEARPSALTGARAGRARFPAKSSPDAARPAVSEVIRGLSGSQNSPIRPGYKGHRAVWGEHHDSLSMATKWVLQGAGMPGTAQPPTSSVAANSTPPPASICTSSSTWDAGPPSAWKCGSLS